MKTKRRYKRFTKEEDLIVVNEVRKYPTNLSHAFSEAVKVLNNRTVLDLQNRWYRVLRKKYTTITVGSKVGFTENVKNVKRDSNKILPSQGLKPFRVILKDVLELSQDEIALLIQVLTA